jgi:hypothetical protein
VLNPSELYRWDTDPDDLGPSSGVLMVTLGAFVDAGNIQRVLSSHLLDTEDATLIATFDLDQLFDYRGRRPAMVFDTNRWVSYDGPSLEVHRLTDRDGEAYYLLNGPEPDYQWERLVEAVSEVVTRLGISIVVSVHGIPMGVPHTRPVGMTAHATDPRLVGDAEASFGRVQVPASLASLLELRLGEAGRDALGFAVHVPHYLAQAEWAEGALAALNAVVDATGLSLPNDDLVARVGANRAEIAGEVAGNEEAGALIAALERQYDTFVEGAERPSLLAAQASDIPSADELGAEFEAFLKNVSDDDA